MKVAPAESIRALARIARGPVRIYLTGGSTAVLKGWRDSTIAVAFRRKVNAALE